MRQLGKWYGPEKKKRAGPEWKPKIIAGTLDSAQAMAFLKKRLKAMTLPRGQTLTIKGLSATNKIRWFTTALLRKRAAGFDPKFVREEIIPIILKQPEKAALGLGKRGTGFFFAALGSEVELLFHKLCEENKLEKFVKRLYRKDMLAYGDAYHLAKGVAAKLDVFFAALDPTGSKHFKNGLRKGEKTEPFLRGLQEMLGVKSELYQLAKTKLQ